MRAEKIADLPPYSARTPARPLCNPGTRIEFKKSQRREVRQSASQVSVGLAIRYVIIAPASARGLRPPENNLQNVKCPLNGSTFIGSYLHRVTRRANRDPLPTRIHSNRTSLSTRRYVPLLVKTLDGQNGRGKNATITSARYLYRPHLPTGSRERRLCAGQVEIRASRRARSVSSR